MEKEKISYSSSSKRISRSISFSKSPGETPSPRPRRMIIRALGSRLEFSSLFRYSSAIPVLLASWYCDIWRDSRILTSAAPNRHCFTVPAPYSFFYFYCLQLLTKNIKKNSSINTCSHNQLYSVDNTRQLRSFFHLLETSMIILCYGRNIILRKFCNRSTLRKEHSKNFRFFEWCQNGIQLLLKFFLG